MVESHVGGGAGKISSVALSQLAEPSSSTPQQAQTPFALL